MYYVKLCPKTGSYWTFLGVSIPKYFELYPTSSVATTKLLSRRKTSTIRHIAILHRKNFFMHRFQLRSLLCSHYLYTTNCFQKSNSLRSICFFLLERNAILLRSLRTADYPCAQFADIFTESVLIFFSLLTFAFFTPNWYPFLSFLLFPLLVQRHHVCLISYLCWRQKHM